MLAHKKYPALLMGLSLLFCSLTKGQNIRPFTKIFSQNIKGSTAIFGNTSMQIIDNSTANLEKMNESGTAANGVGGIGFSQYGNDEENMQPVITDFQIPILNLIQSANSWNYNDISVDLGTSWQTLNNPSGNWANTNGNFGYGRNQNTTIKHAVTNYFLKTVTIATPALYSTFDFSICYDDAAVIYVNGVEVKRLNLPAGTINYNTTAINTNLSIWESFSIPSSYFNAGENIIAVEVHQITANSNTCFFDMRLSATPAYTSNSSTANLILPAGTNTIKYARLYWGGKIPNSVLNTYPDTLKKIKIRKGTSGIYTDLTSVNNADTYNVNASTTAYQSYVDVTNFIQNNGSGTYSIAEIPMIAGSASYGGNYAGWCIVIAYENNLLPLNSVRIYDGFSQVYNNGSFATQTVTLTGLNIPNNPLALSDAVLSTMAWEGDANISSSASSPTGDYVKINGITVSNAVNPATNFFNGSISKNGAFVHTKNPDFTNQMGIDIDELEVGTGYGILPNATELQLEFGTEADKYFPGVFALAVRMKNPVISINKSVADANADGILQNNELLTYTLSGSNNGPGSAYKTIIVDTLPMNVTYVPNSMLIIQAPGVLNTTKQSDEQGDDFAFVGSDLGKTYVKFFLGNNASYSEGGLLDSGANYQVKFKVRVNKGMETVRNTGMIFSRTEAGELITAECSVSIGAESGPLAVKLISFNAVLKNKTGLLNWVTENEFNNDYFDIERSEDGVTFYKKGSVKGNGTSAITQYYQYNDNITTNISAVYYRLKIVDLNGNFSYSKIIILHLNEIFNDQFSVYPNPFVDNLKISLNTSLDVNAQYRILSFDGKEILSEKVFLQKGINIVMAKDLYQLASGIYFFEINTGFNKYIKKIVKK